MHFALQDVRSIMVCVLKFPPIVAVAVLIASVSSADAQDGFVQNQSQFRAALENRSNSPSFVLITVIDGRSGARTTGCIPAQDLLGAILKEKSGSFGNGAGNQLTGYALSPKDHVFLFRTAQALAKVTMDNPHSRRACDTIRTGHPAFMSDRSGEIRAGQP